MWMLKKPWINHCFACVDSVFNPFEIQEIKRIGLNLGLQQSQVIGGVEQQFDQNIRNSTNSWINISKETAWIYEKITWAITVTNNSYFEYDLTGFNQLQFTSYDVSDHQYYGKHIDAGMYDMGQRKLSFSIQLSEEGSYDGGELCFYETEIPIIAPKKIGTMIAFPSYKLHEVTPVLRGTRFSLVGWVEGPRFK